MSIVKDRTCNESRMDTTLGNRQYDSIALHAADKSYWTAGLYINCVSTPTLDQRIIRGRTLAEFTAFAFSVPYLCQQQKYSRWNVLPVFKSIALSVAGQGVSS